MECLFFHFLDITLLDQKNPHQLWYDCLSLSYETELETLTCDILSGLFQGFLRLTLQVHLMAKCIRKQRAYKVTKTISALTSIQH